MVEAPTPPSRPAALSDQNKLLAALGYPIGIVALVLALLDISKQDRFVKYHAWQALFLWIAVIVLWIASLVISIIPILGWIIGFLIGLLMIGIFIYSIVLAVWTYQGKYFEVPVIYGIAKKYME